MTLKQTVVSELGNPELLAPERIARSLVANDQVKYYLALLQTAQNRADAPLAPAPDLHSERMASQLSDDWLDDVVAGTRKDRGGAYRVPHAPDILRRIRAGVQTMLDCLPDPERTPLLARLGHLDFPALEHGAIPGQLIDAIASGNRKAGDSVHLVVMDAHRAINRLQAETAVETVAGARVHRLSDGGRQRVEAFMAGLNRTAPLKFDHPGLGTTATEHNGRLLIQNDIGTTDAHVLVVRVHDLSVSVAYTDIHRPRLKFFQSLFSAFDVSWESTEERHSDKLESGQYLLATGTYNAEDDTDLLRFLTHLGSRIVFLIDWNHMRKRLRMFVGKARAIEVLKWAAEHDYGHRALIEVGGERALAEAVEYAAGQQLRYGQRLDELISEDAAAQFLREAMRLSSIALRQRRSRRAVQDEINTRLRRYFENERLGIFDIAAAHATLDYDMAFLVREALERLATASGGASIPKLAARAVLWEAKADQRLNEAREDIKRFQRPRSLLQFFEHADDAVDELEEAAALVDLALLVAPSPAAVAKLKELADLALSGAQELVKCVECAATVTRSDVRDDLDEFLDALERLISAEHTADEQLRSLRRWLIVENVDVRETMVVRELAQALETATDAQAHAGQLLRTYLVDEVIA
jgi:uncharacterized protein Yka (UPF0111/DUF47 family)